MQTLPQSLHVGMKVFDSEHHQIGKINDLRFPENAIDPDAEPAELDANDRDPRPHSLIGELAEAFGGNDMPEVLRERLLNEGYIRIDGEAPFAKDHFALPSQIASAAGDEVMLNVKRDELITRH